MEQENFFLDIFFGDFKRNKKKFPCVPVPLLDNFRQTYYIIYICLKNLSDRYEVSVCWHQEWNKKRLRKRGVGRKPPVRESSPLAERLLGEGLLKVAFEPGP